MYSKRKGIIYIILSAFFFSLMGMLVHLSGDDLPTFQKVLFRNLVACIFAVVLLIKNNISFIPQSKKNIKLLILRTILGAIGMICNFYCVDRLLLPDASILNKTSPFFAMVFSFFLIKEKPKLSQWLLILGAFIGAIIVIKPSFVLTDVLPGIIGLIGGACAGGAYACVRKLSIKGEKGPYIIFFFSFFSTLLVLPGTIITFKPMATVQLLILLGAGLAAALGQLFITYAYSYAPAKEIAIYDYSQLIFSTMFGFIFLQFPDIWSIIGYIIIIAMAIINYFVQNKENT